MGEEEGRGVTGREGRINVFTNGLSDGHGGGALVGVSLSNSTNLLSQTNSNKCFIVRWKHVCYLICTLCFCSGANTHETKRTTTYTHDETKG